ncbi:MAG: heparinase II/III-family protein, partial [Verrucomicrobiae bacterium]|nr:heparinase II/III-family protein [Verrucomicrobiae bacterium]
MDKVLTKLSRFLFAIVLVGVGSVRLGNGFAAQFQPPADELERLAASMDPRPLQMGPRISDRGAWEKAATRPDLRGIVVEAEQQLKQPLPEMTDELYLDYSRTGNRRRAELVLFGRRGRIGLFTLAECIENKGRFLPAIEGTIRSICKERTWVMPAHDGDLGNFLGRKVTIDLAVAMLAWDLATADSMLGDKLSSEVRRLVREEIEHRVFAPYKRMVWGEQDPYWLLMENNWNAVCLAGVTGAALTMVEPVRERAWFVLVAAHYCRNFLSGFTPDGYCSEGVGYWNYGFGHFVALGEAIRRATRNTIDLLGLPAASRPATYGAQIEIVPGVCPAFADCDVNARPDPHLLSYLRRRFGAAGLPTARQPDTRASFYWTALDLVESPAPVLNLGEPWPEPPPLRTWFTNATVLICRPKTLSESSIAVAILGGHNAEHHNHNDVGTFTVVVGREPVLPDIGAEVYTRRTFSNRRYESKALNSYGHAVPVVAGRLQRTGQTARADVLALTFTDDPDTLALDIKSAYDVPTLQVLERRFVYNRTGRGSLEIVDRFSFSEPESFETALLTFGKWYKVGPASLRIADRNNAVRVVVETPPATV